MDRLTVYPDGTAHPGVTFEVANGFVARVVGAIADSDQIGCLVDAQTVCGILNRHVAALSKSEGQ